MTHDEIIKLVAYGKFQPEVAAWFIAYSMGAAAEREECAKICEVEEARIEKLQDGFLEYSDEPAQFLTGKAMAARTLAISIRARGEQ